MRSRLFLGECAARMAGMPEASVGAIVCDPPYGLEFLGKTWDKLDWQAGGGFAKPGIGARQTAWPSYSATAMHGAANPTCAVCGGRLRGAKKCACPQPHEHWKPIGKRRNPENEGLPDTMTSGGMARHLDAIATWHQAWLAEAYRVLVPGGVVKAFSGTRTYHRLAAAYAEVGFVDINLEAWGYGSGFPKSLNVGKAIDKMKGLRRTEVVGYGKAGAAFHYGNPGEGGFGNTAEMEGGVPSTSWEVFAPVSVEAAAWEGWGTALKPAWEPVIVGRKPVGCSSSDPLLRGTS